jgi:MFS family permease
VFERTHLALANLATITYLKEKNASYGAYFMWGHIGTALSISSIAGLAWLISIPICGVENSGYFIAFIWAFVITLLSMLSLPWLKYEYNEKKSNWSGVKYDIFNAHYIFMFAVLFYAGLCVSFQAYWEFWYLDGLSASPLLLAIAVLIRRSLVALSTLASSNLIRKIGDLYTICFALFLFSTSFLALSFTRIAWLVLIIDTFQAAAYGISYCAFTVLFYKASSKENSSIILGMYLGRTPAHARLCW